MEPDETVSKLLRLKRYELPPEGYHQSFLQEFHRRQRSEMLKMSPWQRLWQSLGEMWPNFEVPRMAYAACLLVAIGAGGMILRQPSSSPGLAANTAPVTTLSELNRIPDFSLETTRPVTIGSTLPVSSGSEPSRHYVLQPRPASTDNPLSF